MGRSTFAMKPVLNRSAKTGAATQGAKPTGKITAKDAAPAGGVPGSGPNADWGPYVIRDTSGPGGQRFSFRALYDAPLIVRADLVRTGAPAAFLSDLIAQLQMPKERVYLTLGVARATADRKLREDTRLGPDATERAMGLARLVGQVETIVAESGDPDDPALATFDPGRWVADFLGRPHPALGGRTPGALMDTADGRQLVSDLVARMQSGAYA